jgi:hypothetical protein
MYAGFLVLITGSHVLTGTIALNKIFARPDICALAWGVLSLLCLFALALPKTFKDFAWLGYLDVLSILAGVFVVIIAAGMGVRDPQLEHFAEWSLWLPEDQSFYKIFLAVTNIVFAYSFSVCQYALMAEMHTPKDYMKSIWSLGLIEIVLYTVIGATLYAFVGKDVDSPALLSASPFICRIAFGVALPVIFISGSINTTVVAKYLLERYGSPQTQLIQSKRAWAIWVTLIAAITILAWAIAEAVPFFSSLLGIISSLFISGFSFYYPALFWFCIIMEDKWYKSWKNICRSIICAGIFLLGIATLVIGTYSSVMDITAQYQSGEVRSPFTCNATAYA